MILHSIVRVAAVASALLVQTAHAANVPESQNSTPSAKSRIFTAYDCQQAGSAARTAHMGQVINGTYREWIQNYNPSEQGTQIVCMTVIKPAAQQLSKSEASMFFIETPGIAAPAAASGAEPSAVPTINAETLRSVMLRGISPQASASSGYAAPASAAVAAERQTAVTEPTSPRQLFTSADSDNNVILDLGYGSTPAEVERKAPAQESKERPAAIGTDDRTRVLDKSGPPWNTIGPLVVTWKDGTQTMCTGTMVSPWVVLSSGQCAHNRDRGGFAVKASFAPGQLQNSTNGAVVRPYGFRFADYVETNNRWTQISGGQTIQILDARSDYAAFYFVQPWEGVSTFMPIVYADTTAGAVNAAGYPTEADQTDGINQDLWYSSGIETARSVSLLRHFQVREYSLDVSAGENGAPFWTFDGHNRAITGLVSYGGDEIAGGVWFGGENQVIVSGFVAWTPTLSGPTHLSETLRVPIAIPSGDFSSDSYIRLYNPTAQPGTVQVTFNDGETGATLGTWTSPTVVPFASRQFAVMEMERDALPIISAGGRSRYTLQMTANFPGYFQHVLWNRIGQSLTNLTGCGNGVSTDVIHLNGVHSSRIPDYPSVVFLHNVGSKATDSIIGVYDADNGQRIGGIIIPAVPANATAAFRMNEVEAALSFTPQGHQFHYNLVQESDFPGYLQHMVYNTRAGLITNMTAKCVFPIR
jgi:V8-like Glu-specific endopeptidase